MGSTIGRAMDVGEWFFPQVPPSYDAKHELLVKFKTSSGNEVPGMLLGGTVPSVGSRDLGQDYGICVIYFHPNACDIGHCLPELEMIREAAFDGDAVILAPEYPGYGLLHDFDASPAGIDKCADAAWQYCRTRLGFQSDQIVIWGRSIGTGPASALSRRLGWAASGHPQCDPALQRQFRGRVLNDSPGSAVGWQQTEREAPFGALVLVAPFTSITAAVSAHAGPLIAAFVDSMWKVSEILQDDTLCDVPLCVIHPEDDELIPKSHGVEVLRTAAASPKLGVWLRGEMHNFHFNDEHLDPVRDFLARNCPAIMRRISEFGGGYSDTEEVAPQGADANRRMELASQLMAWGVGSKGFSFDPIPASK